MLSSLSELKLGDEATVIRLGALKAGYKQKLLALGLVPGVNFRVDRVAPFGDPVQICLATGVTIIIRKQELHNVAVKKLDG